MSKALVIGAGEVGSALASVLSYVHEVYIIDKDNEEMNMVKLTGILAEKVDSIPMPDVMHICIPYTEDFIRTVWEYQERFPCCTVIHSTVPIGTSELCNNAVHSPVVGLHPNLPESLLTFTKFLSGRDASYVADHFRAAGMKVYLFPKSQTTEALKILSTTMYAVLVEFTKEVDNILTENGLPYSAWTVWTEEYNRGYALMDRDEFMRPQLVPVQKTIGGHCLLPNCKMIADQSDFATVVLERNKEGDWYVPTAD